MTINNKKDTQGQTMSVSEQQTRIDQKTLNNFESFGLTFSKKSERLATAVYLITNFVSDTEPMKFRLRTLSLDLIETAYLVRYKTMLETNVFEAVKSNIIQTVSLLELGFTGGLISEMNFSILKREYGALRDLVDVRRVARDSRSDTMLGEGFFDTTVSIGHSDDKMSYRMSYKNPPVRNVAEEKKMTMHEIDKGHKQQLNKNSVQEKINSSSEVGEQKSSRSNDILVLIKDKGEVSIKDISAHFPQCSEKTIQRELTAMTESGVLKKYGERRWSRYCVL